MRDTLASQGRVLAFYWWVTLHVLRARKPRFATLHEPLPREVPAAAPAAAGVQESAQLMASEE